MTRPPSYCLSQSGVRVFLCIKSWVPHAPDLDQTELPHASCSVCFALRGAPDGWGLLQRGWGLGGVCFPAVGLSTGSQTPRVLWPLDARCKPSLFKFLP